jgi:hypothetical protein
MKKPASVAEKPVFAKHGDATDQAHPLPSGVGVVVVGRTTTLQSVAQMVIQKR